MQTNRPKGVAREAQRYELTGVPTSTWYDLQNAGLAPKPIHLGPRSVGWLVSELEAWVEQRRAERDANWASCHKPTPSPPSPRSTTAPKPPAVALRVPPPPAGGVDCNKSCSDRHHRRRCTRWTRRRWTACG